MFKGISYVGIGVSNIEESLKYYGEDLGFKKVIFDYTGTIPGIESLTERDGLQARIVLLESENVGAIGPGMIKLVQILKPNENVVKAGEGLIWGELYITEACFKANNVDEVFADIVTKGFKSKPILTPGEGSFPPYFTPSKFAYFADPDGSTLEISEAGGLCKSLDGKSGIEGLNHVGFGVTDMDRSLKFYEGLGFETLRFDSEGYLPSMATLFPEPIKMRIAMVVNFKGAWIEPIQWIEPHKPRKAKSEWGMIGPMEYAIGVSNIDKAYKKLKKNNYKFLSAPQVLGNECGELRYAYLKEPDGHYLSIVEVRC